MYGAASHLKSVKVDITGPTRNSRRVWQFAPLNSPVNTAFLLESKIKYFVVLSVSSCEKFFERKRNHINGELSEWSKVQHSKSPSANGSSSSKKPLTVRVSGIRPPQAHREF